MSGAALLSGAASAPDAEALPALTVEGLEVSVRTEAGLRPLVSGLSFTLARGDSDH